MSRADYVSKLEAFYQAEQCGCAGCRKHDLCSANGEISGPKEAFVGSEYGENGRARLVVMSLDPGSSQKDSNVSVHRTEDGCWIAPEGDRNHHWWRTLEIVFSIFGDVPLADAGNPAIAKAVNWMAMLNSARCTQNKKGHRQADSLLFDNCLEFAKKELEILKPEILITQGEKAWNVVAEWAAPAPKEKLSEGSDTYLRRFEIAGQPCRHVHLYHPTSRGNLYPWERDNLIANGVLRNKLEQAAIQ